MLTTTFPEWAPAVVVRYAQCIRVVAPLEIETRRSWKPDLVLPLAQNRRMRSVWKVLTKRGLVAAPGGGGAS